MYALLIFGPLVERRVGSKKFLTAYFLSGIIAALSAVFFYPAALGASGAIMGIIGMVIIFFPDLPVLLFFVFPTTMRVAGIIFAMIDIFFIFVPNGVANIAHLGGLLTGLIFGYHLNKGKLKRGKKFKGLDFSMSQEEIDEYFRKNGR